MFVIDKGLLTSKKTLRGGRTQFFARPLLEQLEQRVLLDTYLWTGIDRDVNLNWSNRVNWILADTGRPPPSHGPGASDTVIFTLLPEQKVKGNRSPCW